MPIDPSIIGNIMAPQAVQMPDVNAMMRTQTQGMENIYQIEAARKAQAKEEAKAQEDAAVKALFPAYSYVLETGDLAGGLELAPPQYRDVLIPHMKTLEGRSLPEIQAALTGSLVASETGRALLENRSRAATLGVQQGQLDVARQNVILQRQKQELDARGDGDWSLEPGVDEQGRSVYMWVNPRTRQIEPVRLGDGAAPGAVPGPTPIPAPDVVTPRQPAPGMSDVAPPAGAVQPPTFRPVPKKEDALTEAQGKSFDFALRMIDSDAIANELEKQGVVTTDTVSNFFTGVVRAFPDAVGRNLADQIENAFNAVSPTLTPEEQRLARAQLDFVTAKLRSESGAEIKASEFPSEYKKYFPVAGDEGNEKLLSDKRRARKLAIAGMRAKAGAGNAEIDRIIAEQGAGAPAIAPPAAVPAAPGATDTSGFKIRAVRQQ